MKKTILLLVFCVILTVPNYAQNDNKSELNKLNKEVVTLYTAGKLEKAIKVSNQIVEKAKKSNSVSANTSAIYLATAARLKKEMYQQLRQKMMTQRMKRNEWKSMNKKANDYAIEADENFSDAIKSFDEMKSTSQQAAFAKSQYAWLLYNHPGKPKQRIVRDPSKLKRYEDAERMYLESIAIYDKTLGKESDQSILTTFDTSEFYLNWLKFEKAIPLYERFIQSVEKKYGKNQVSLTPALKSLADIMVTTDRADEAKKLTDRISKITGKETKASSPSFNLELRKKFSAAFDTQENIIRVNPTGNFGSVTQRQGLLRGGEGAAYGSQIIYGSNSSVSIKSRSVLVKVLIDEKGKVIEVEPANNENPNKKRQKLIEEAKNKVKGWSFEPFIYKGKARKMRGFVNYVSTKIRG